MRRSTLVVCLVGAWLLTLGAVHRARAESVLLVGNSFIYGHGTAVRSFHAQRVTDLNHEGIGGVPALLAQFLVDVGHPMDVALETHPGADLDWHWREKRAVVTEHPYDFIVLQSYSTLDAKVPGDATALIASTAKWVEAFKARSPQVRLYLVATWSRPDLTFPPGQHWSGQPITQMALDVRHGVDQAARAGVGVVPVGEAFNLAMASRVAIDNPYVPQNPSLMNLWGEDHYHASAEGYYLEALMIFETLTHRRATDLGEAECAAYELGISPQHVRQLQQVATQTALNAGLSLGDEQTTAAPPKPHGCPE